MKKLLAAFVIVCLMLTSTTALAYEFLTTPELHEVLNQVRMELARRELFYDKNTYLLLDHEGINIYLTGSYSVNYVEENFVYITFESVLMNNTEVPIWFNMTEAYVNGWLVGCGMLEEVNPARSSRGGLDFIISDAFIESYEEIEDIEIYYEVMTGDSVYYKSNIPITVRFS